MVTVTEAAQAQLTEYFKDKEQSPVRIFLASGGCSGASLALALDEAQSDDETYDIGGQTFVVDKALSEAAGELTVDMTYYGFEVRSENNVAGEAGGSCSPQGGCGSGCCGGCH